MQTQEVEMFNILAKTLMTATRTDAGAPPQPETDRPKLRVPAPRNCCRFDGARGMVKLRSL